MRRIGGHVAFALVFALALAACDGDNGTDAESGGGAGGDGGTTTTSPSGATSTSEAASPVPTEPVTTLADAFDSGKSELADGRHFGYWAEYQFGDTIATGEFDLAYFLTGADAEAAAAEKGDTVENDYYIVNDNPRLRTLVTSGDAEVLVLGDDRGPTLQKSDIADFEVDRHKDAGFWVTIDEGRVTKIEEQYQP